MCILLPVAFMKLKLITSFRPKLALFARWVTKVWSVKTPSLGLNRWSKLASHFSFAAYFTLVCNSCMRQNDPFVQKLCDLVEKNATRMQKRAPKWSLFSPFCYFPNFSAKSKQCLHIEYHVHIWQLAPQPEPRVNQFWQWSQMGWMFTHHRDGLLNSRFSLILNISVGLWVGI